MSSTIWKRVTTPEAITTRISASIAGHLGIRITELRPDAMVAEMPVNERHLQPQGVLHGGVSVVLAETLGTIACILTLPEGRNAVGLEVNANHVASVKPGQMVTAVCRPLHTGSRTQVWQTEIRRADGKLACVSRLTCAVLEGSLT
jgi:1,4-dihydroxy-2-naphthoyl-CoA hydrolase